MDKADELIKELLADYKGPEDLIGANGLMKCLTKKLVEGAMGAEMTHHLGYEKHGTAVEGAANARNGTSPKTLKGDFGQVQIDVPRDRDGSFEPKIVAKHQRRFAGFNDKILSMYARGMSTREIQGHLAEIYAIEVNPTLISEVTDAVIEEVKLWQNRPLENLFPILFLDALIVKMRHEGTRRKSSSYVAIGIDLEGQKDVLGLCTSVNEGSKFWLQVLTDLRNRGVKDVFLACVDGLKGFPQAIESVFPHAQVQLCIVHLTRASLNYVSSFSAKQSPRIEGDLWARPWKLPSRNSTPFLRNGMRAIQRSARYGSGTGNGSSRSSPTRPDSPHRLHHECGGIFEYVAA